ncbi:MAG: glycosyltransferase family 2 protein [Bdellovibrionaceae bacterium]|nr:glycosyltransferase family 2 protein [Pseudobdellovibrionaceae bacterium]
MTAPSGLQLSLVIPTRRGASQLGDLLVSILRQQSPPSFEVLVVANVFDARVEQMVLGLGSRFRYFSTGKIGVNHARNIGLNEARGQVTLFLEDDAFLEEPLVLKRHYDLHQKTPTAIAIGGRYTLKRRATAVEQAYHWVIDHRLSSSKIDGERTTDLCGGNTSFKTAALRAAFSFNEEIVFGGADTDLNTRLHLAGHELILSERLGVEHRLQMNTWTLLQKAFAQGRAAFVREREGLSSPWRFQGKRYTWLGNLEERGLYPSSAVRFCFAMYGFAFKAGYSSAIRLSDRGSVSRLRILSELCREFVFQIQRLPRVAWVRELRHAFGSHTRHVYKSSSATSALRPSPPG